ncbi:L-fucose:H+ symporter permease [Klebsiella oxytoca]|uniref:L-fucose:H+ symporter permease n=1 Tax=Klebsiella oxytoca TaxID=571 RepID=UPI001B941269|nr:L-fucose:H+ symporter permease [Klebsiella oxytoca]EKU2380311.1 L-fucose:H+ symporter permease [Klebsiella oxytoca]ELQ9022014.1 L-fucose:H+ symporter permease [Klebsiella oxytoca]MBX4773318.1 L-fucose:H+ symporter permease [Klebsiella oxytoca]MBZ7685076.1 L-fucose:H+ symporter permease [Klebsiella oxytoca]MCW9484834.1 L-fucose:H+ symporter permease [Klebsiella oxytoca]
MSTLITDKVDKAAVHNEKLDTSAYLPHTPWLQFLLVCCLFALWGMAGNLNDILIAQFKKGFDLTDTQTALVQSIFFLGYFFVALPAAALIKHYSYKAAIIIGLCLYALGCFLFVPAAQIMTYGAFLACLGVIACGLSFLETSANTYSSLLGPIQSSTQRINFSQIFNSLGVISGVLIGQVMVFGENDPSHEQLLAMPAAAADAARHQMVGQVVGPYLIIGSVLVVLALVFVFIKFPSCKGTPSQQQQLPTESMGPTLKRLFAIPRFRLGILSQFLYVGAQVGVWSFTIRFVQLVQQGTSEHSATYWLLASLVIYAVGKTVATWLMNRLNPALLLGSFALAATVLLLVAVFSSSMLAVYALILVSFCMAPCWPTNFGLVIKGMGKDTQTAGSIVVMSIIGGAVIPLVMGIISDMNGGNMQIAFIAPLLCFVYVAFYGFWCVRKGV